MEEASSFWGTDSAQDVSYHDPHDYYYLRVTWAKIEGYYLESTLR